MKAEEYDELLDDPVEFAIRRYLPRIYGVMKPLENLPPLHGLLWGYGSVGMSSLFAQPDIANAFESFYKAGRIIQAHQAASAAFTDQASEAGFPQMFVTGANAPFDVISDHLRGIRGTMTDMYRRPEKLLAAIDKLTPRIIATAIAAARSSGNPGVFMALHRGAAAKAKDILGGKMCSAGMMPLSLLQVGTPDEVRAHAKMLIDMVGKGGGYIMGPKSIMDEAKPELVKVWIDFTKEYGVYR